MSTLDEIMNQPAPPHLQARLEPGEDPIEAARRYGIDIERLRAFAALTPDERLDRLQAMVNFVVEMHALLKKQRDEHAD